MSNRNLSEKNKTPLKIGQQYQLAPSVSTEYRGTKEIVSLGELTILMKVLENGELSTNLDDAIIKNTPIVETWVNDGFIVYTGVTKERDLKTDSLFL